MATIVQFHDDVAIKKFPINKSSFRIGRSPENDVYIDDKVVSMKHAIIEMAEDPKQKGSRIYYIKDLGSTNSTYVNEEKITQVKLRHNDLIRIGLSIFRFLDEHEQQKPEKTLKIRKSWFPGVYYTKE